MKIKIEGNKIKVSFPFDKSLIYKCRHIGMSWKPAKKYWHFPDNFMNRKLIVQTFPDSLPDKIFKKELISFSSFYKIPKYLMNHQRNAVKLAEDTERHLYAHDTGVGKTLIGIELIKQKKRKTLVVCPLSIIEPAWFKDLRKFAPELKAVNLWEVKKKNNINRMMSLMEDADLGIINFESFKSIIPILKDMNFEMLFIDESSKIKNFKSQITKALSLFCDDVQYVYLFSGTPAPNSYLEYFSQMRIIDPTLFGRNYYRFRNKYFYSAGYGGYTWLPKRDTLSIMLDKIGKVTSVVRKEDVLDLPDRTDNVRDVQLNSTEKKAYVEMVTELIAMIDDEEIPAYNAAVKGMKLRQITAGFLYDEDKVAHDFGKSKLNELESLLEEIGNNQVLIWTQFLHEAYRIRNMLGDKAKRIDGSVTNQSVRLDILNSFINGDLQYLIAHPKTLGHGTTMVNCHYAVYFSLSYSHEEHYQSRDRIYRKGQKNFCSYYYLVVPNSIDRAILNCLKKKSKAEGAVFSHIKASQEWREL